MYADLMHANTQHRTFMLCNCGGDESSASQTVLGERDTLNAPMHCWQPATALTRVATVPPLPKCLNGTLLSLLLVLNADEIAQGGWVGFEMMFQRRKLFALPKDFRLAILLRHQQFLS